MLNPQTIREFDRLVVAHKTTEQQGGIFLIQCAAHMAETIVQIISDCKEHYLLIHQSISSLKS
jgi:hypothetical protein